MGAQFFFGQPDGLDKIVQALVLQRCQSQPMPDLIDHGQVFFGAVGGVVFQKFVVCAFELLDGATAGQVGGGAGGGEV